MRTAALLLLLAAQAGPRPEDPESPVHPRKFGSPGGIGQSRGWYLWGSFDPETWRAEVMNESSREKFTVRVLPWVTTYRHLVYGASPEELLPGERVNLFFNPEGSVKRAYLVHFQDEVGQMKGHKHAWQVESVGENGREFAARGMSEEKPLDAEAFPFALDPACRIWREGKSAEAPGLVKGEKLYLTWCAEGPRRIVKMIADGASLDALRIEERRRVDERIAREGMAGFVETPEGGTPRLLVFSTWWAQAAELKQGRKLAIRLADAAYRAAGETVEARVASRKNLGAYGSGPTEIDLEGLDAPHVGVLQGWSGGKVVRVFAP